ncbi:MAG: methylated-DNA--[protein]-cysteine S-methyltransferase [Propionibacteriales bacterium]|nr:methylated-DNA--[protein]-cysteine S-methyltransferase [Propionibacteriales bacterium]
MTMTVDTYTATMDSPVGPLVLRSEGESLTAVSFSDQPVEMAASVSPEPVLAEAQRQLCAYFAGQLEAFDLPLAARGSQFQQRVWSELTRIPYGATASYGEIAARLGAGAGASRAVGVANGSNPIAIVVPCHRVIGSNGKLTGYAGGLDRKRYLLGLEASSAPGSLFAASAAAVKAPTPNPTASSRSMLVSTSRRSRSSRPLSTSSAPEA